MRFELLDRFFLFLYFRHPAPACHDALAANFKNTTKVLSDAGRMCLF
jgi:hypothetical protein